MSGRVDWDGLGMRVDSQQRSKMACKNEGSQET